MGIKQLNWWDRNAPLPGDDDRKFSWDEARQIVLDALLDLIQAWPTSPTFLQQ